MIYRLLYSPFCGRLFACGLCWSVLLKQSISKYGLEVSEEDSSTWIVGVDKSQSIAYFFIEGH